MDLPKDIVQPTIRLTDGYFDLKGLSTYCSLAIPTLRDHLASGTLPYFKCGGKILVKRSEFDKWMEKHRQNKERDLNKIMDETMEDLRKTSDK